MMTFRLLCFSALIVVALSQPIITPGAGTSGFPAANCAPATCTAITQTASPPNNTCVTLASLGISPSQLAACSSLTYPIRAADAQLLLQTDAQIAASVPSGIVRQECSQALLNFKCSAYFPQCDPLDRINAYPVCKSVCEAQYAVCGGQAYGACDDYIDDSVDGHANCTAYSSPTTFAPPLPLTSISLRPTRYSVVNDECVDIPNHRQFQTCNSLFYKIRKSDAQLTLQLDQMIGAEISAGDANAACTQALQAFACATYLPRCNETDPTAAYRPCRSLCLAQYEACGGSDYGACDIYPDDEAGEECTGQDMDNFDLETLTIVVPNNACVPVPPLIKSQLTVCGTIDYDIRQSDLQLMLQTEADIQGVGDGITSSACQQALQAWACATTFPQCDPNSTNNGLQPCKSVCVQQYELCGGSDYGACDVYPDDVADESIAGVQCTAFAPTNFQLNPLVVEVPNNQCVSVSRELRQAMQMCTFLNYDIRQSDFQTLLQTDANIDVPDLSKRSCALALKAYQCAITFPKCDPTNFNNAYQPCRSLCKAQYTECGGSDYGACDVYPDDSQAGHAPCTAYGLSSASSLKLPHVLVAFVAVALLFLS